MFQVSTQLKGIEKLAAAVASQTEQIFTRSGRT